MKSGKKDQTTSNEKWETFEFDFKKVMDFCGKIKTTNDKILYLEFVLKEKKNGSLDLDMYFLGPTFEDKIKNEIDYLNKELKLKDPYMAEGYDKIVWAKNKQEVLCNHFIWSDGEMKTEQLRQALNNINNKPETHQLSDEIRLITDKLKQF